MLLTIPETVSDSAVYSESCYFTLQFKYVIGVLARARQTDQPPAGGAADVTGQHIMEKLDANEAPPKKRTKVCSNPLGPCQPI